MSDRVRFFKRGVARANRVGMMALLITLFQYGVPTLFMGILRLFRVDTTADFWGMPAAQFLCLYLLMYLLMIGTPLWLCLKLMPSATAFSSARLSRDRRLCVVLFCVALCVLANILTSLLSGILYDAGLPKPSLPQTGDGSFGILLVDLLVFAVVPAVMEEYLMRGVVLQTLRPLGDGMAVLLSAVLFGLMHGNLLQTPYALLMGVVLGGLYLYTTDLRPCILVHALSNATAVIVSHLFAYSDADTASFWQLTVLVVVMMMGGVASLWLWRHPLARTKAPSHAPFRARINALMNAPLLWLAVITMVVLLIVRTL